MSVKVKIPTLLRPTTGGNAELQVDAATVRELIEKIVADYPDLRERVLDGNGEIRAFVNVYVEDEDVRFLEGLDTPVLDRQVVSILPAVAGGR
ncbi:MAG: MoaD/ThiS family protein [Actinomycetota bacterium]